MKQDLTLRAILEIHQTKFVHEAETQIAERIKEIIGQDYEYHRGMPVPDPDPFALPQDHQNQLRRYQRSKLNSFLKGSR